MQHIDAMRVPSPPLNPASEFCIVTARINGSRPMPVDLHIGKLRVDVIPHARANGQLWLSHGGQARWWKQKRQWRWQWQWRLPNATLLRLSLMDAEYGGRRSESILHNLEDSVATVAVLPSTSSSIVERSESYDEPPRSMRTENNSNSTSLGSASWIDRKNWWHAFRRGGGGKGNAPSAASVAERSASGGVSFAAFSLAPQALASRVRACVLTVVTRLRELHLEFSDADVRDAFAFLLEQATLPLDDVPSQPPAFLYRAARKLEDDNDDEEEEEDEHARVVDSRCGNNDCE
ncbi:hypothetical protein ATCC90586_009613 [Pythium insidiosum]|nr:hypothetical protein ATCC90586_009613 [Pythium insidiosum]